MRAIKSLVVASTLGLLACASAPAVRDRPPLEIPSLDAMSPVEALGYELYRQDQAAWQASDIAMAWGAERTPATGWITLLRDDGWIVRFVGSCGAGVCSFVDVEKTGSREPSLEAHPNGAELPPDQAARWHARETAAATKFRACTPRYNTVVTSTEVDGEPAWRVYLLASSDDPNDVVLTGHHRITVSADGRTVLREEPLSKSCGVSQPLRTSSD